MAEVAVATFAVNGKRVLDNRVVKVRLGKGVNAKADCNTLQQAINANRVPKIVLGKGSLGNTLNTHTLNTPSTNLCQTLAKGCDEAKV